MLELTITKPTLIYFRNDHSITPECHGEIRKDFEFDWACPTTWSELAKSLEDNNDAFLAVHADMMTYAPVRNPIEFMDALYTITKFMKCHSKLRIGVVITKDTPLSLIRDLQNTQCQGILLDIRDYSNDEVNKAINALYNHIPYWPKHILDNLPGAESKPVVLHFRADFANFDDTVQDAVEQGANCTRIRVSNWNEFTNAIYSERPEFITIHYNRIDLENYTLSGFINCVRTMMDYIPKQKQENVPIAIGIDRTCTKEFIAQLQKLNIAGIFPAGTEFGTKEAIIAVKTLLSKKSYWPAHIINQLPTGRPLSIYFRGDWNEYKHTFDLKKLEDSVGMDLAYCSNWNELDEAVDRNPHQLIFQITELERMGTTISEIAEMMKTKLKIHGIDIPMAVGIMPYTTAAQIRELKRAGIHGVVPNAADWGIQETVTAMHALRDRVPYWPKHIIDQLPGNVKKKSTSKISLTSRQAQVFHYITARGSSNKVIARALGISESTVKLHVTEIFKKYGVKSRTQLAVFSNVS